MTSFRVRLSLLFLFAVLPALGLMLYAAAEQRQLATVQAQEEALRLLRQVSSDQERLIEGTHQLLKVMADLPEIQGGDSVVCSRLFANLLKNNSSYIIFGLAKLNGDLYCSAPQANSGLINVADRAYFQRTLNTHDFAVGDYVISRTTGKPTIHFAYPVFDGAGQVQVILIAGIDLAWLNQMATKAELPTGRTLTVIEGNGTVLSRYPDPEKWVGKSKSEAPIVQTVLDQKTEGTAESIGIDGITRFYAFGPLYRGAGGVDVYIYTGIPNNVVFADANRLLVRNLVGLGLVAILALTIAWVGGNLFFVRRVNVLLKATQRLTAGDLGTRSGLPHDQGELGQLALAFDNMAMVLEQRTVQFHQAENRYRILVEQIPAVTYMLALDEVNSMLFISPQIEQMLGFSLAEWLDDSRLWHKQLHPDDCNRVLAELAHSQASGKPFRSEYRLLSKDGQVVWVNNEARVVQDGQLKLLQGVMLNISDRKQVEEALGESLEKFRALFHNANDAIFLHNITNDGIPGRLIEVNDIACQRLGYSKKELLTMSSKDIDAPEYLNEIPKIAQEFLTKGRITFEMAHVSRNGTKIPVEISFHIFTLNGTKVVLSIARDITQRKQAEDALKASEANYRAIFESVNDAIFVHDKETGEILNVNLKMQEMYGYTPEEARHLNVEDLSSGKHPYTQEEGLLLIKKAVQGEPQLFEWMAKDKTGRLFCVEVNLKRAFIDGKYCVLAVVRDITERKQMEEQLKYLSLHDPVTGIYNRVYFEQEMGRLESGRHNPVGIIICDVDGLKLLNDTMGHNIGDKVLVTAAGIIRQSFREDDVVARIGGDEFAVLLPDSDSAVVESASQRIRNSVALYNEANTRIPLSISVGFAVSSKASSINMAQIFKEADSNMYREKLQSGQSARIAILQTIKKALNTRDFIIEGHVDRLQSLVAELAMAIGLPDHKIADLHLLARYHDIGKVGIPDCILFKSGSLTPVETTEMQRHCEIGYRIAMSTSDLVPIADWILKHHEWWNGNGYPLGIKGGEVPLECGILAIADAYDSMTSIRPYRKAMIHHEAVAELKKYSGSQFNPQLVSKFIELFEINDNKSFKS